MHYINLKAALFVVKWIIIILGPRDLVFNKGGLNGKSSLMFCSFLLPASLVTARYRIVLKALGEDGS